MNNPFTAAIVRHMLAQPKSEITETCIEWLHDTAMNREEAARKLAGQLHDDLAAEFRLDDRLANSPNAKLVTELLEAALCCANFSAVARALLDCYVPLRYRPAVTPSIN